MNMNRVMFEGGMFVTFGKCCVVSCLANIVIIIVMLATLTSGQKFQYAAQILSFGASSSSLFLLTQGRLVKHRKILSIYGRNTANHL